MLGEILKELRVKKNVTQDDMAELLKIKRQTYSAYERGVSTPDANSLLTMANFFGVSVDYILENETKTVENEQSLSKAKSQLYKITDDLTEEERIKLLEYAELLKRGRNQ